MRLLKYSTAFTEIPVNVYTGEVITTPAIFKVEQVGQRTVKYHPAEIIAVVTTDKDDVVDTWYTALTTVQKQACKIISRADADILLDNYIQVCSVINVAESHCCTMQKFLDAVV